jgi:hypothetical protein
VSLRVDRHVVKLDVLARVWGLSRWPVTSQIRARRNALMACTALAQRRAQRIEVEQFLSDLELLGGPEEGSRRPAIAELRNSGT